MRFEGKVIIVTGASSGIGRATAKQFAMEGGKVVAAARRFERLEALRDEVAAAGAPGGGRRGAGRGPGDRRERAGRQV